MFGFSKKKTTIKLTPAAQRSEELEICKELHTRLDNVSINPRDNQFLESSELADLQDNEWLGTHHINAALAMLRFVFNRLF